MKIVILGSGIAGLSAGLALQRYGFDFEILERKERPGGLTATDIVRGFKFDRIAQFLHFQTPWFRDQIDELGLELEAIERRAAVMVNDRVVPCPFQYNLWALEPAQGRDALADLRFSSLHRDEPPQTLEEYFLSAWGRTMTDLFFRPYNEKLWRRPLAELPADCPGRYMPRADLSLVERGLETRQSGLGYNGMFWYPRTAQIGEVTQAMAEPLNTRLRRHWEVQNVDLAARQCHSSTGKTVAFDRLISTIPLPALVDMTGGGWGEAPPFDHTRLRNVRVGFRGMMRVPFHWLYIPDPERRYHRIGFPRNINTDTCPEGCASMTIECSVEDEFDGLPIEGIARDAVEYLTGLGHIDVAEILTVDDVWISPAYVVHRSPGRTPFERLRGELERRGVRLAGRFGMWDYLSMDEAFLGGQEAAAAAVVGLGSHEGEGLPPTPDRPKPHGRGIGSTAPLNPVVGKKG